MKRGMLQHTSITCGVHATQEVRGKVKRETQVKYWCKQFVRKHGLKGSNPKGQVSKSNHSCTTFPFPLLCYQGSLIASSSNLFSGYILWCFFLIVVFTKHKHTMETQETDHDTIPQLGFTSIYSLDWGLELYTWNPYMHIYIIYTWDHLTQPTWLDFNHINQNIQIWYDLTYQIWRVKTEVLHIFFQ